MLGCARGGGFGRLTERVVDLRALRAHAAHGRHAFGGFGIGVERGGVLAILRFDFARESQYVGGFGRDFQEFFESLLGKSGVALAAFIEGLRVDLGRGEGKETQPHEEGGPCGSFGL